MYQLMTFHTRHHPLQTPLNWSWTTVRFISIIRSYKWSGKNGISPNFIKNAKKSWTMHLPKTYGSNSWGPAQLRQSISCWTRSQILFRRTQVLTALKWMAAGITIRWISGPSSNLPTSRKTLRKLSWRLSGNTECPKKPEIDGLSLRVWSSSRVRTLSTSWSQTQAHQQRQESNCWKIWPNQISAHSGPSTLAVENKLFPR